MEAQQCVKLSPTNRSIGLIYRRKAPEKGKKAGPTTHSGKHQDKKHRPTSSTRAARRKRHATPPTHFPTHALERKAGFDDLVAMARGDPPDPIPNSAVKSLSADGTAS